MCGFFLMYWKKKRKDKGSLARSKHTLRLHVTKKGGKMCFILKILIFCPRFNDPFNYHFKTFTVVALKIKNYNSAQSISLTPTLPCNHSNDHSLPYSSLSLQFDKYMSMSLFLDIFLWISNPVISFSSKLFMSSWDIVNKSLLLILRWPFW